ncbi:MAG: hypothetical protein G01um101477_587 [Candidatus Doudnabacteria bacterium Gr01-1014_77]|uniref:Uncharacterized protein n=1 Tax=Candidatus Doudnabacteria bacterium Gr01-1014_77 TaxID=2017133 RepID=A0A554JA30_9BACT|nr:MAG: hypothetical protein G01um101477_587 [Candidatus Doudnabacteria bacterium Gr01-1014_77]
MSPRIPRDLIKHLEWKPGQEPPTPPREDPVHLSPTTIANPATYILLPEGKYGKYDYPDLLIGMQRLSYNAEVEAVNTRKSWEWKNTAKDAASAHTYDFIGNMNHQQAIELNRELGNITLSTVLGREFVKLLREGIDGRIMYGGDRNPVVREKLIEVYNDMTEKRDPWRSEWFDTKFTARGEGFDVTYPIFKNDGWEYVTEELEEHLKEKKCINMNDWLLHSNLHGLPRPGSTGSDLYYWPPSNGSVARFGAYSDWSRLGCGGYPAGRSASLGVRAVAKKTGGAP